MLHTWSVKKSTFFKWLYMGVSKNMGTPPNHPFVHRVFHEINHPFWGTIIFGNTHIVEGSLSISNFGRMKQCNEGFLFNSVLF